MQSPQTGGKSGQAPGQSGGKGFGGGGFKPQDSSLTQDMTSNLQNTPQQADGNMGMGSPLPPMGGPMQPMGGSRQGMQQTNPGGDMYGSGVGQSTNPQQPVGGQGSAGGKGMAGMAANGIQAGMGQGNVTYPSQSGQPMMGMPNAYSNTVGQPNSFSEQGSMYKGGKGTGGSNNGSGA